MLRSFSYILILMGILFAGWNIYHLNVGYFSANDKYDYSSSHQAKAAIKTSNARNQAIANVRRNKPAKSKLYSDIPEIGQEIGQLTIPRIKKTFPIYQGTDDQTLRKGVGHFPKSALPGEKNNVILSGHRDTVFRGLKDLVEKDQLLVTTEAGEFLYKVHKIRIVDADDQTVMKPKPRDTLTLTTCYPFYFIGDAPQRYVIVGDLISSSVNK
jgi:sortase A